MSEGQKFPQYLTSIVSSIGALMTGLALGWTSPVEVEIESGKLGFKVSNDEYSWAAGTLPLGAALACIPAGFLIAQIGRKITLCILPIIFLIGWFIIQFAQNTWMLYVGRIISGMACGAVCAATPIYIGEIAQKEIRGSCGNFFQLLITLGVTLVYLIGAFVKVKLINYVCMGICVVQFLGMISMPESPTYLIEKNREEEAVKAMIFLRGKRYDSKPELDVIKADILERRKAKDEKSHFVSFNDLACFRALYITLGLMLFQQFSGINAVIFYASTMIAQGGSSLEPRFSSLIIVTIGSVTTLISGFFVDKLGRRLLLLLSSCFMACSTTIFGFYFYFWEKNEESVKNLDWIPIAALCVFTIMFSFGYGPVPWIMIGELFAADVRGPAGSVAATSNWLFAFVISKSYVTMKNLIGVGITFWFFSVISVIGVIFVLFLVPETKGKSLQEIQDMLSNKKPSLWLQDFFHNKKYLLIKSLEARRRKK